MKLGRDTGSLTNYMMSGTKGQPDPHVGMGCTLLHWSDRDPATIKRVDVPNSKLYLWEIEIWSDEVTVVRGSTHDGSAEYKYTERDGWEAGKGSLWRLEARTGKWVNGRMEGYRKILANDGNWYGEVQTIIRWTVFYEIQGNYQFMLPIPDKFCFQWRGLQEIQ